MTWCAEALCTAANNKGIVAPHLVGCLLHCERAADLSGAAAIHNGVVAHQVARHTQRVVQRALDLVQHLMIVDMRQDWMSVFELVSCKVSSVYTGSERLISSSTGIQVEA